MMTKKRYEWRVYLGILLPAGAGVGALIGLVTGQVAIWVAVGAGLGVMASLLLARTTSGDETP
jgi:uncharacterized membrane protein YoaK (UPF0700 family)